MQKQSGNVSTDTVTAISTLRLNPDRYCSVCVRIRETKALRARGFGLVFGAERIVAVYARFGLYMEPSA